MIGKLPANLTNIQAWEGRWQVVDILKLWAWQVGMVDKAVDPAPATRLPKPHIVVQAAIC